MVLARARKDPQRATALKGRRGRGDGGEDEEGRKIDDGKGQKVPDRLKEE